MNAVVLEVRGATATACCLLYLAAVSCLLSAAAPSITRAEGLHVATQLDPCVPLDREKFEYLFNIELGAESAVAASTETAATLTLSCADKLVVLSVQDEVTQKVVTRLVDLSAVDASARTRLMALTAAELVLASWMEVRMEPRSVIPPAGPPPAPELAARVSEVVAPQIKRTAPPLRLGASATTSGFLSALSPIFGLALHLTQPFSESWAWNLSLLGGLGYLDGSLGERGESVSVAVKTAALTWSLRYTRTFGDVDVWAGVAALVGVAYLTGAVPATGMLVATPAYAPWAGPALQLAAAYPISPRFRVLVQLEAGLLLLGSRAKVRARMDANDLLVTELRGGWVAAQLGFDYAL